MLVTQPVKMAMRQLAVGVPRLNDYYASLGEMLLHGTENNGICLGHLRRDARTTIKDIIIMELIPAVHQGPQGLQHEADRADLFPDPSG